MPYLVPLSSPAPHLPPVQLPGSSGAAWNPPSCASTRATAAAKSASLIAAALQFAPSAEDAQDEKDEAANDHQRAAPELDILQPKGHGDGRHRRGGVENRVEPVSHEPCSRHEKARQRRADRPRVKPALDGGAPAEHLADLRLVRVAPRTLGIGRAKDEIAALIPSETVNAAPGSAKLFKEGHA